VLCALWFPQDLVRAILRLRCGFRRRDGLFKAVGYDYACYGNSAERKRNVETGFGRKDGI